MEIEEKQWRTIKQVLETLRGVLNGEVTVGDEDDATEDEVNDFYNQLANVSFLLL